MNNLYINIEITKSFWDLNPDVALVSPFKRIIADLGKRRASTVMWSIYLAYYPTSVFYLKYKTIEDREKAVNKEYNAEKEPVDFNEYADVIKAFTEVCIPHSLLSMVKWEETLRDFDNYIDTLTFEKAFKTKTEGLKNKKALWDMYLEAKREYDREMSEGGSSNWGGYQGSMLENDGFTD